MILCMTPYTTHYTTPNKAPLTTATLKGTMLAICLGLFLLTGNTARSEVYIPKDEFLAQALKVVPKAEIIWLDEDLKKEAGEILGHSYRGIRIRYWRSLQKTAWILDEIGKEKPITVGIVIDGDKVVRVAVLAFRESRGWEVKYPFFTNQFTGVGLASDGSLNESVDGISGATLSVRAVTKVTRLALYLHNFVSTQSVGHE